jgi:hypothetical protein
VKKEIRRERMRTYREVWRCPASSPGQARCYGEMKETGVARATNPYRYEHRCTLCGHMAHSEQRYPRITHETSGDEPEFEERDEP